MRLQVMRNMFLYRKAWTGPQIAFFLAAFALLVLLIILAAKYGIWLNTKGTDTATESFGGIGG